jgi:hypothetical protein
MTLEATIEARSLAALRRAGAHTIKFGSEGWPDQLVLWGNGLHFWIEFKKEKTGRLRASQKARISIFRRWGDVVYLVDTYARMEQIIRDQEEKHGQANCK